MAEGPNDRLNIVNAVPVQGGQVRKEASGQCQCDLGANVEWECLDEALFLRGDRCGHLEW